MEETILYKIKIIIPDNSREVSYLTVEEFSPVVQNIKLMCPYYKTKETVINNFLNTALLKYNYSCKEQLSWVIATLEELAKKSNDLGFYELYLNITDSALQFKINTNLKYFEPKYKDKFTKALTSKGISFTLVL